MFNFEQVKILLQTAGITSLTVKFDEPNRLINITYVFKGRKGVKQFTYEQLENSFRINGCFTMSQPTGPTCPAKDSNG